MKLNDITVNISIVFQLAGLTIYFVLLITIQNKYSAELELRFLS